MNTINRIGFTLLVAALTVSVKANQQPTAPKDEQRWVGTITAVDTQAKILTGKHWQFSKSFDIGQKCAISTVDNKEAALGDLRPGEKVKIRYQEVGRVLVADRIAEKALHYDGTVGSVDQKGDTITMEEALLYRPFRAPERFQIASECKVILWNGHDGRLAEVRPGDRISVVYELPNGSQVAYRIRDRSSTFTGTVDAIDLSARTLKAKEMSGQKTFDLADHCQILLDSGKPGHLNDLTLGQRYKFTFEDLNGVNVLDRIAPVQEPKPRETASIRYRVFRGEIPK